jgi:hypothetical protein
MKKVKSAMSWDILLGAYAMLARLAVRRDVFLASL